MKILEDGTIIIPADDLNAFSDDEFFEFWHYLGIVIRRKNSKGVDNLATSRQIMPENMPEKDGPRHCQNCGKELTVSSQVKYCSRECTLQGRWPKKYKSQTENAMLVKHTDDSCPKCQGKVLLPNEDGDPQCLNCGFVKYHIAKSNA